MLLLLLQRLLALEGVFCCIRVSWSQIYKLPCDQMVGTRETSVESVMTFGFVRSADNFVCVLDLEIPLLMLLQPRYTNLKDTKQMLFASMFDMDSHSILINLREAFIQIAF